MAKSNLDLLNQEGTTALEAWGWLPIATFGERAKYLVDHAEQFGLSDEEVTNCINQHFQLELTLSMMAVAQTMLDELKVMTTQSVMEKLAKSAVCTENDAPKSTES